MKRVCLLTLVLVGVPAALAFGPLWVRVDATTYAAAVAAPGVKCICGDRSRDGSGCICADASAALCKDKCGEKCPVPCPPECLQKCAGPCGEKCREACQQSCPGMGKCVGRGQGCKRAA